MESTLAFGGSWFWIVTVLFALWAISCVESSRAEGASFVICVYLALLYYYGDLKPFPWIIANPEITFGIVTAYLLGGTFWAIMKWRFYVFSKARLCEELRRTIGKQNGWKTESFADLDSTQKEAVFKAARLKTIPPSVLDEKSRIIAWMMWWPLSAAWTIVNDPIRRLFQQIYFRIAKHLQGVSDKAFENLRR